MPSLEGVLPILGLQKIRIASFYACALVLEGERSARRGEIVRYAFAVLGCLQLHPSERVALFLSFDNSDRRSINEKKIVCLPYCNRG